MKPTVPHGWVVQRESPGCRWLLCYCVGDMPPVPLLGQDLDNVSLERWAETVYRARLLDVTVPLAAIRGLLYAIETEEEPDYAPEPRD